MTDAERRRLFNAERRRVEARMAALGRSTLHKVLALLTNAQQQIRAAIAEQPIQQEKAARRVNTALRRFRVEGAALWTAGIAQAWQLGVDLVDEPLAAAGVVLSARARPLREAASVGSDIKGVSERQLAAMQEFMVDRIADISVEARDAIKVQLGLAVSGAQSVSDTIANVDQILGGNARRRASTITNTELNRAFAAATYERMLESSQRVPGLCKQWRRSGKIHSRIEHDLIDGQVRPVKEPFQVGAEQLRYPRDPRGSAKNTINCGCKILPFMKSWQVAEPGARPFTPEEVARNTLRAELNERIEKAKAEPPTPPPPGAPPAPEPPPSPPPPIIRPDVNEMIARTRGTPIAPDVVTHGPLDIPTTLSMGGLRPAQAAVLRVEEFLLVRKKREHAVVVAADGTLIARRGGGMNSVSFTQEETDRMFGAVLSHNHPSGFTFSVDDIRFAAVYGLSEIRVYTRRSLYRLRQPEFGWSPHWVQATLMPAVKRAQMAVAPIALAEARKRGLSRQQRNQLAQDLLIRYLANQLYLRLQVITP
jgi:hypothetical protein